MFSKKSLNKLTLHTTVAFMLSVLLSMVYIYNGHIIKVFDDGMRDYMFALRGERPHNEKIIIIDIDAKSLAKIGQWPWSRNTVSKILTNLRDAGVGAIGMDIVFAENDRTSPHKIFNDYNISIKDVKNYDEIFAHIIATTPTIIGYVFELVNKGIKVEPPNIPGIIVEKNKQSGVSSIIEGKGMTLNIPLIQDNAYSSGFFNHIQDSSNVVRSIPLVIRYDNQIFPSLALELIRVAYEIEKIVINYDEEGVESISLGDLEIPTDRYGRFVINYRGDAHTFTYISAVDIIENNFDKESIQGSIALLGTSASGLFDLRATPLDIATPGVEIHANAIDNILTQNFIIRPSYIDGLNIAIIVFLVFLTVFLVTYSPLWIWVNPFIMLFISAVSVYIVYYILFDLKIVLDLFLPLVAIVASTIVVTFIDYFFEVKKTQLIQKKFASKVSEGVMQDLLENMENNKLQAMERNITVFFSDVRDFTSISESAKDPSNLIKFMNAYMDPMTNIIVKNKGTIDKYIGDAIMAYWNAPALTKNHEEIAVQSSLEQLHTIIDLNKKIRENKDFKEIVEMSDARNKEPIDIGIGLNTGLATIGEMGSSIRSDYTVIGDAINLGARLESLCKYYDSKLNISHFVKNKLKGEYIYRFLDLVKVKGKKEPVEIWQIHDFYHKYKKHTLYKVSLDKIKQELSLHHQAIAYYKDSKFQEALDIFRELEELETKTNVKIYKIYIGRCEEYIANFPQDFDGIYEHLTKG